MKSYHASLGAGIDGLSLREHELPRPGPGQVLVRVRATSLSFRELMILRGRYPLPVKPDLIPVSDGAGEVVEAGDAVGGVAAGDRVMGAVFPRWADGPFALEHADQLGGSLDGMLTEYAVLDAAAVVPIPAHLSFEQAACLPCVAVTAWNALTGGRGVRPGETVVTLGSGGVSLFALAFAKAAGARVIATTSSQEKARRLRELGADDVLERAPGWAERVRERSGGADLVVEVAGTLDESLRAVAVGGEVAFVGLLAGGDGSPTVDQRALFGAGAVVRPVAVGSRAQFVAMNRAIETNGLVPVIDREFPFDEAVAAYRHYATAEPFGKVVITHP